MSKNKTIPTAAGHLDSQHADHLFREAWDNEDFRIGIYKEQEDSIQTAHQQIIEKMDRLLPSIKKGTKMLILDAGYGATARTIAEKYNCSIDSLNLDPIQNEWHENQNKTAELDQYITIIEGGPEQIPFTGDGYDIIWAQDSLLFIEDKNRFFRTIARSLKPEGRFIFTAIMQKDNYFGEDLEKLFAHLQIEELTSLKFYKRIANHADLEQVYISEMPEHLGTHYSKLLEKLEVNSNRVVKKTSKDVVNKAQKGLQYWVEAHQKDCLNWGILQFQKRNV